jgi:hypothetical protein
MQEIKDVTSTTFGLIIAYLLPGLTAFYAMSFWSLRVENWFNRILNGDASAGLIVFVIFGAIVIGLQLSGCPMARLRVCHLPRLPLRCKWP